MKMLHKYILLLGLLLQAGVGIAAPDRDSLMTKVIERGRIAFKELVRQNKLNDEKGLSSQNHYVLHINTADLIDGQIDKLDKEYIKQRKITYGAGYVTGDETAGDFLVPAGEDLDELEAKLEKFNTDPNTKVRAYLVTVDFIPMIFDAPGLDLETLMTYYRGGAGGTKEGDMAENAKNDAAAIIQGISLELVAAPPEDGTKPAFNTACFGMVNYRIYDRKRRYKKLQLFSWSSNLVGPELTSYNLLVSKHLQSVKGETGHSLIEKFIDATIKNNTDFTLLSSVKSKIFNAYTCLQMYAVLSAISANAYDQLSYEERIRAIKVLASEEFMSSRAADMIVDLLSTANLEEDAGKLKEDLDKVNDLIPTVYEAEDAEGGTGNAIYKNLSLLHLLVNGISDAPTGDKPYTRLMQVLINVARLSPTAVTEALDFYRDPKKLDRTIVWDKSYVLELFAAPPAGINKYEVTLDDKLDKVTIKKSQLEYEPDQGYIKLREVMREYTKGNHTFIESILKDAGPALDNMDFAGYYEKMFPPEPKWVDEPAFTLGAWQLVSFTNKSDIGLLATAVGESSDQKEHKAQFLPAIVLKYAADKKLNENINKGVVMAFDAITLVTPVGELAYLGKVANYVYKGVEYGAKITAVANLAVETGVIPPDSKLAAFIKECHEITLLLQLGNLGFAATNGVIAKLSRAEASKFLETFYGAEKEGLLYLAKDPETVKAVLRFKRELEEAGVVAGYGENWFKAIKDKVYGGISSTVAKVKDKFKFLTAEGSGNLLKFKDGAGQQVMHTMADGTLVVDKTAMTIAEDARVLEAIDGVSIRTAENAKEIVEDLMFVQRANKSVECIRGACFIAGTPVRTKAGLTPIEQVKENDTVLGVKVANGDTTWQKVAHVFTKHASKLVRIITGRDTIFSTPEHPYLTENGWKSAADLKAGWRLRLAGHAFATLTAVLPIDTSVTVYNFETSITHNYCIGSEGIVVHNSCEIIRKLESRIPKKHYDDFIDDFKNAAKGSDEEKLLKKFNEGKISTDIWVILHDFPSLRANADELVKFRDLLGVCTTPNCTALLREIVAGEKGFNALNQIDRNILRSRFEEFLYWAKYKNETALAAQLEKYVARLKEAGASGLSRIEWVDPKSLRFSQGYVGEEVYEYVEIMKANKWDWTKSPLEVAEIDGYLVSLDNRRLLAAQMADVKEVSIRVVTLDAPRPGGGTYRSNLDNKLFSRPSKRKDLPKIDLRPYGSPNRPKIEPNELKE